MKDKIKALFQKIGRLEPDIPKIRGFHNRVLKPLYLWIFGDTEEECYVFGKFKMKLRVKECVDGSLFFAPHLYERKEIKFIEKNFPNNGVFIDVGAYKGFWSLYFASKFPLSQIIAIEANPSVFDYLIEHIKINHFSNIIPLNIAVSNEEGEVNFLIPSNDNLGGARVVEKNDFKEGDKIIKVNSKPLSKIITELNLLSIEAMKIDVEGYELKVLDEFFRNTNQKLFPHKLCVEYVHCPEVIKLILSNGYQLIFKTRDNALFQLKTYV
jgi:FkbM family methyltransferase